MKAAFNKKLKKSILVDSRGYTLYVFGFDTSGKPTCTDDPQRHCSKGWPPLKTTGASRAGQGVKSSLLGVVKNPEGGMQVTYAGHPLYTFRRGPGWGAGDKKPGDVNGRSIAAWHVISPTGAVIFL